MGAAGVFSIIVAIAASFMAALAILLLAAVIAVAFVAAAILVVGLVIVLGAMAIVVLAAPIVAAVAAMLFLVSSVMAVALRPRRPRQGRLSLPLGAWSRIRSRRPAAPASPVALGLESVPPALVYELEGVAQPELERV